MWVKIELTEEELLGKGFSKANGILWLKTGENKLVKKSPFGDGSKVDFDREKTLHFASIRNYFVIFMQYVYMAGRYTCLNLKTMQIFVSNLGQFPECT